MISVSSCELTLVLILVNPLSTNRKWSFSFCSASIASYAFPVVPARNPLTQVSTSSSASTRATFTPFPPGKTASSDTRFRLPALNSSTFTTQSIAGFNVTVAIILSPLLRTVIPLHYSDKTVWLPGSDTRYPSRLPSHRSNAWQAVAARYLPYSSVSVYWQCCQV